MQFLIIYKKTTWTLHLPSSDHFLQKLGLEPRFVTLHSVKFVYWPKMCAGARSFSEALLASFFRVNIIHRIITDQNIETETTTLEKECIGSTAVMLDVTQPYQNNCFVPSSSARRVYSIPNTKTPTKQLAYINDLQICRLAL